MPTPQSVLIVDASDDSREVLSTVLNRRGVATLGASEFRQGAQLAQSHKPDLIILDLEADDEMPSVDASAAEPAAVDGSDDQPSLVILGGAIRDRNRFPTGEFVPKPYHYASLIRRIEQLLAAREKRSEG